MWQTGEQLGNVPAAHGGRYFGVYFSYTAEGWRLNHSELSHTYIKHVQKAWNPSFSTLSLPQQDKITETTYNQDPLHLLIEICMTVLWWWDSGHYWSFKCYVKDEITWLENRLSSRPHIHNKTLQQVQLRESQNSHQSRYFALRIHKHRFTS